MNEKELVKILQNLDERLKNVEKQLSLCLVSTKNKKKVPAVSNINFNIHRRAFVKKYSAGLSGPAKFTLLVAYLAKGRLRVNIALVDVKGLWNSMSGLLGGKLKTGIYGTRAKEKEWLDSAKREMYNLTQKWQGIFK